MFMEVLKPLNCSSSSMCNFKMENSVFCGHTPFKRACIVLNIDNMF
jgi:hypothetical protein